MTRKGKALYAQLLPRLLRKESEIMACLTSQEQNDFARLLGKIETSFDLIQTSREADEKETY
jgi:DNA-binding MarR family transcriptional regulator